MSSLYGIFIGIFLFGTAVFIWYNQTRTYDLSIGGGIQENMPELNEGSEENSPPSPLQEMLDDLNEIDLSQFSTSTATSSEEDVEIEEETELEATNTATSTN